MMERLSQIPDDLPACQKLLRGVLEQLHEMEVQLGDMKRQLDEMCATNGELQRSYDCLKEQYEAMRRSLARTAARAVGRGTRATASLRY